MKTPIRRITAFCLAVFNKFVFGGLSNFYKTFFIFLCVIVSGNFFIQDIKNRITRSEIKKKVLLVEISQKEAHISAKIIEIINQNQGTQISPKQISILHQDIKEKTWWQKLFSKKS